MQNYTFIASASELQSSDLYMTVKATLFTVPEANLNGVRCTHDFMAEIVENQEKYIGLPLCADVKNLALGRYEKLGHCYNSATGTFLTSMIGSFYKFEIVATENDSEALVGYARILKRNKTVCKAIGELFAEGALKFSFEIACGSYQKLEDGTILIDKADDNYLEGMCIVSFPACPEAVALQLVAEIEECNKDLTKEAEHMPNEEVVVAEEEAKVTAEEQQETAEVETAEETVKEVETAEEAVESEESKETAEVVVHESHTEIDETCAYDTDTGDEVRERIVHEVDTCTVAEEESAENAECKKKEEKAEEEEASESKADEVASLKDMIAELREELVGIRADIGSVRSLFAEREEKLMQTANPFMAEIKQPKKYSLLDSDDKPEEHRRSFSLLDPA